MILVGDCLEMLRTLPDESVDCIVTSPPYYGLRDYGVDGQIGLEDDIDQYLACLVEVFDECRRVLKRSGTCWVNIGDSYADSGRGSDAGSGLEGSRRNQTESRKTRVRERLKGIRPKNLIGLPWRLALALQDAGWNLRRDIIWHKPSPMPESCKDRPSTAHEYIFLLSKSRRYYYDLAAIAEPCSSNTHPRAKKVTGWDQGPGNHSTIAHNMPRPYKGSLPGRKDGPGQDRRSSRPRGVNPKAENAPTGSRQNSSFCSSVVELVDMRNARSVWTIASQPFKGAHFATFPPELPKRCILAGCPEGGTVLDPFAGSGTTLMVAKELGRKWIGIELNPEYAEMARLRIAAITGSLFLDEVS